MAAAYIVSLPVEGGQTRREGVRSVVVYAESTAQAKEAANALYGGDSSWANATVTAIAAPANYSGWTLRLRLAAPNAPAGTYAFDVSVTGDATNDTIDELAALAVTALNATAIDNAAYNSTTQVLTVAGAADNLGQYVLQAEFTHPDFQLPISSLIVSKTDAAGSAATAVTVTFNADAVVPPKLYGAGSL